MKTPLHAFVLHHRAFRETSLIVDLFTFEEGVISVIAKGAKRPKSKLKASLQFFTELLLECYGRSELLGVKSVEIQGAIQFLSGDYLLSALYINELIEKLIPKHEPHPTVFHAYASLLAKFFAKQPLEPCLREFEMTLIADLGYGLAFEDIPHTSNLTDTYYQFSLEDGFTEILPHQDLSKKIYSLEDLLKVQQRQFSEPGILSVAKQLFRQVLAELLHGKTINSRQLFVFKK